MASAEYQREWKRRNPERVKQYRLKYRLKQEIKHELEKEQARQLPTVTQVFHEIEMHKQQRIIAALIAFATVELFGFGLALLIGAF